MKDTFEYLQLSQPLMEGLKHMGFEHPTEVQAKAIPLILEDKDMVVISKTGSGKTAVFGLPLLHRMDPLEPGPLALIATPTRELAVQVDQDIREMARFSRHQTAVVYGQHSMSLEHQQLKKKPSLIIGTPGRLLDHIQQGSFSTKAIRYLVLDEADRMLDMGFIDQVQKIIRSIPKERQTLLFSATMPEEIKRICQRHMKTPVTLEIASETKTVDTINQIYYRVQGNEKRTQLNRLLLINRPDSCIIFCNTRIAVDQVLSFLTRKGYGCQALHGDIPQSKRLKTITDFKAGKFPVLVATDVAGRGIHVDDLSLVINYDVPQEKDSYVHRIGRTGRAGQEGRAITLVTAEDLFGLYEIEEHIGAMIPEGNLPTEADFLKVKSEAEAWIKNQKIEPAKTSENQIKTTSKGSRRNSDQRRSAPTPDKSPSGQPRRQEKTSTRIKVESPQAPVKTTIPTAPQKQNEPSPISDKPSQSFYQRVLQRIIKK